MIIKKIKNIFVLNFLSKKESDLKKVFIIDLIAVYILLFKSIRTIDHSLSKKWPYTNYFNNIDFFPLICIKPSMRNSKSILSKTRHLLGHIKYRSKQNLYRYLASHINLKKKIFTKNNFHLNEIWKQSLNEMRSLGVTKLPIKINLPFDLSKNNQIQNTNEELKKINNYLKIDSELPTPNNFGFSLTLLDVNSEFFLNKIFTKELFLLIKSYYGKDFSLRNRPHLRLDLKEFRKEEKEHNYFHLDHCERQVHMVILLNDLNENSTHTQYIPETNKKSWVFVNEERKRDDFKKIVSKYKNQFGVKKIIGKRGDVFLFDAGNGLHRACYGDDRGMIKLMWAQFRKYAQWDKNYLKKKIEKNETQGFIELTDKSLEKLKENFWDKKYFNYVNKS